MHSKASASILGRTLAVGLWQREPEKRYLSKEQQESFVDRQNKFLEKKEAKIRAKRAQ